MNEVEVEAETSGFNMDIDMDASLDVIERKRQSRLPVREVCRCGHNAGSHSSQGAQGSAKAYIWENRHTEMCSPGRQACPCAGFVLAATCADVRLFKFKTSGRSVNHALHMGIVTAKDRGIAVSPAGDWSCSGCGAEGVAVVPVPFSLQRLPINKPGPVTLLLCAICISDLDNGLISFASTEVDIPAEA